MRFAPSPNGRLHLGHAFSALLNKALARRIGARLLLRIEDIDPVRSRPDLVAGLLADLAWLGLAFEEPVRRQSEHMAEYRSSLEGLAARGLAYPCFCSRGRIAADAAAHAEPAARDPDGSPLYPGTCRDLSPDESARRRAAGEPHSWRLDMGRALAEAPGPHAYEAFDIRRPASGAKKRAVLPSPLRGGTEGGGGAEGTAAITPAPAPPPTPPHPKSGLPDSGKDVQISGKPEIFGEESTRCNRGDGPDILSKPLVIADPSRWGDPVIGRRDVPTSYHLAVVLDDAVQDVTHVVRGADLEAATDLHVLLQRLLGLQSPAYHHHALILGEDGEKLAKSKGSPSLADLRVQGVTPNEVRARLGFV